MKRLSIAVALSLGLLACSGEMPVTQEAAPPKFATLVVAADQAAPSRGWDGVIEAVQQADLTAQTSGRVTQVLADVNSRVPAGAVLVRLSAVEQQAGTNTARAQLRAAEAQAIEAEKNYQRFAALGAGQYVARAQIDNARASRDAAMAARDAARAQVTQAAQQTNYTIVRAPFSGVVAKRLVEPGESVAPGQPLMTLYAPGALRIEVMVPQSQAAMIKQSGQANVQLANGEVVAATRVIVYPTADVATHSVTVRVELPTIAMAPTPGETAKVIFPFAANDNVAMQGNIRIPNSALVQRGELTAVYVMSGNEVLLRQIRIGNEIEGNVDVLAGLQRGEKIVLDPTAAMQWIQKQRATKAG